MTTTGAGPSDRPWIRWFQEIALGDVALVGGKTASLGELHRALGSAGVYVPYGFAITAEAYRAMLALDHLGERIATRLQGVDGHDLDALAAAGTQIRQWVEQAAWPVGLGQQIVEAYRELGAGAPAPAVAVRSSATAEDLPEASFAGQQETFLNVRAEDELLHACRRCFASLFTDRAIAYRLHHGFDHLAVSLSIAVQRMVHAGTGVAGVTFTLHPESGFRNVVVIDAAYGLGEAVVQGQIDPDEFVVFKPALLSGHQAILKRTLGHKDWKLAGAGTPQREVVPAEERARLSLTDTEVLELARMAMAIEAHYGRPMDIEWAKDGDDGRLYVLQARPETVHSVASTSRLEVFSLVPGTHGEPL